MVNATNTHHDHQGGTAAPWYEGRSLTEEKREFFRQTSLRSREAKLRALRADPADARIIHRPAADPSALMPRVTPHLLPSLSLFSGGGGLDLGFERAGFRHVASFDTLEAAGDTLRANRPKWEVRSGEEGDVRQVNWRPYRGELAVLHGGPPCQPFSVAGRQRGRDDSRNMLPEFVRAVQATEPLAFVCENVPALAGPKFAPYLREAFLGPLVRGYSVTMFKTSAHDFGVPQLRHRVFFVGFRRAEDAQRFAPADPTHRADHLAGVLQLPVTARPPESAMGVREALGLPDIGRDALAPTLTKPA